MTATSMKSTLGHSSTLTEAAISSQRRANGSSVGGVSVEEEVMPRTNHPDSDHGRHDRDHDGPRPMSNDGCRCHCGTCKGGSHCSNVAAGCAVR